MLGDRMLLATLAVVLVMGHPCPGAADPGRESGRMYLVPSTAIYPGDEILVESLVPKEFPASIPSNRRSELLTDISHAKGKLARRTLLPGVPIPLNALRTKPVVIQGRTYALHYRSALLQITGTGTALQSGATGDIVSVRNPEAGTVVKARVGADAILIVEAP